MLKIVQDVFDKFEQEKIIYCHWKSNERLAEFVNGEGDLDLLFYPEDEERVHRILLSAGAKKFEALPVGKYKNIKDYLAIDEATGKLVHFHVHFGLDIGEKNIKRYSLPWTADLLRNRKKHEGVDVYSSSYEHELLLLIIREILRRPPHKIFLLKNRIQIKQDIKNEFNWLIKRIEQNKLIKICDKLIPELNNDLLSILENGITKEGIIKQRKSIKNFRNHVKTKSSIITELNLIKNYLIHFGNKALSKLKIPVINKRICPTGGVIASFIGSDGAGKSTTINNINREFARKFDTVVLYMGNPKLESAMFPIFIKGLKKVNLFPLWNLYVKRKNLKKSLNLRQKGVVVLIDRYPQSNFTNIMDGPMLNNWFNSKFFLKRWLAKYELLKFKEFYFFDLDLLVKLKVPSEISHKRGGIDLKRAEDKTKIVESFEMKNVHEISVNTNKKNVEQVKTEIVKSIWARV